MNYCIYGCFFVIFAVGLLIPWGMCRAGRDFLEIYERNKENDE